MPEVPSSRPETRVLSLVLHASHPGTVVFDRFGLVDGSFRVLDLHHHAGQEARNRVLLRHVEGVLRAHRPSSVLLGCSPSATASMAAAVKALCLARRIPIDHADLPRARELLLGARRGRRPHALAHQLVAGFAPDLVHETNVSRPGHRARRAAWSAVAIAIAWLVRHRPRSAFAMAHAPAFDSPRLAAAIAASEHRLHPQPP